MAASNAFGRVLGGVGGDKDTLQLARDVLLKVLDGKGGRNAQSRLRAAELLLGGLLEGVSDEALAAEVRRRAERLKKEKP